MFQTTNQISPSYWSHKPTERYLGGTTWYRNVYGLDFLSIQDSDEHPRNSDMKKSHVEVLGIPNDATPKSHTASAIHVLGSYGLMWSEWSEPQLKQTHHI